MKIQSFKKKIVSLLNEENSILALKEGMHNFNLKEPDFDVELLALERTETCLKCPYFVDEPIEFLKIKDERIKELSGKMCDECGCVSSYKLRQSQIKCVKWQD